MIFISEINPDITYVKVEVSQCYLVLELSG